MKPQRCEVWNKLNQYRIRNKCIQIFRREHNKAPTDDELAVVIDGYDNTGTYQYSGTLIDLVPSGSDGEILCEAIILKTDGFLAEADIHCVKLLEISQ